MIKLSISNIAWLPENDEEMYSFMNHLEYSGLEIAPTRIFTEKPYNKIAEAKKFKKNLKYRQNLYLIEKKIKKNKNIFYAFPESISTFSKIMREKHQKIIKNHLKSHLNKILFTY